MIFASPDGLFLVGGGVTRNLTEQTHSQEEWRALQPATLHGYLIDGHGIYAWGRDMAEARRHLEAFEFLLGCELDLRRLRA